MANRINFQIGYTVDKAGLSEMQSLFQRIANLAKEPGNELKTGLQQAAATANTLDGILEKTFNTNLGTLNVTKFNQELAKSGMTLKTVQADLSKIGNQGATAYNRLAQAVLGTNLQLKESNKLLDSMATSMANTVKWGITSSIFNNITNSIQKAYNYSKQLNTSLNDIRIVTDKSADSMDKFAVKANEAAKELGASTLDYTNASLIYYQQGLSDAEVAARAETTIKAANVTGQTGAEVSEQLTAVWNGYKVTAEETELYVDKLAAVAATTAADLEELSVGMSKVAAAANAMGVDFDDLNAQIATIVSVTRQAPESVGTALKTIYARLGDLKVDGVDEFGVKLGEVSTQMQKMGIEILDQNGDLRDMSSVIAEVAEKWGGWTEAQRQAAAVAMAGKRQYNNLIALFDNWGMYTDALETSTDAIGTLQKQQDIYMESTAAKLKTLKATWQDLYDGVIDTDEINTGIDALTNLVQVFDNFIDSFGGGIKSVGAFGAIVADIFNKQIANGINSAIQRQEVFKQNLELAQANARIRTNGVASLDSKATAQELAIQANTEIQLEYAQKIYDARIGLNQEQYNTLTNYQQEIGKLEEESVLYQGQIDFIKQRNQFSEEENLYLEQNKNNSLEILTTYYEKAVKAKEEAEISKDMFNAYKEAGIQQEDLVNIKTQLLNRSKNLNDEERKALQSLITKIDLNKDIDKLEEDILETLNQISDADKRNLQVIQQKEKAVQELTQIYEKQDAAQEKQNNIKQQADGMLELANNSATVAQRITTITSALGSMTMAWSSVNSLMQTWNDESISQGDKLVQTFMTLGMTIPMITSSFKKLDEALGVYNSLSILFSANKAKELALSQLSIQQQELENKKLEEFAIAKGIAITEIEAETAQELKNAAAKEIETIATDNATKATWRLTAALEANPIGLVIAALTALTAVIAGVIAYQQKLIKQEIEFNKQEIEKANKIQEEVNENKELYDSYEKLYSQYKNHEIEKDALYDATDKLCEKYNIENSYLAKMTGNYDKLTEAIRRARKAELKSAENATIREIGAAEGNLFSSAKHSWQGSVVGDNYNVNLRAGGRDEAIENYFLKNVENSSIQGGKFISTTNANDPKDIINQYDQFAKAIEEINEAVNKGIISFADRERNDLYNDALNYVETMTEYVEELRSAYSELDDIKVQNVLFDANLENASSLEEYNNKVREVRNSLNDLFDGDLEKIDTFLNTYLEAVDNDFAKIGYGLESLKKEFNITDEEFQKILKWSEEDIRLLLSGQISFDGLQLEEDFKKAVELAKNKLSEEDLTVVVSLREKMASDKKLTKTQLKEAVGEQSTLEKDYEVELSDFDDQSQLKQVDTLNKIVDEKIALNRKYIKNAKETAKEEAELSQTRLDNLQKEYDFLYSKRQGADFGHGTWSEEEQARLEELSSLLVSTKEEYEDLIDIAENGLPLEELNELNYDNLISGIDGIITEAEVLKNITDDIGESWTIAADKIESFGKNFPEILESAKNYNFLQDGSIQLTEAGRQALEKVLNTRKANLDAINKEYQLELQKQADIQEATADYYNHQADLLEAYLKGKTNAKVTEQKMEEALADYKTQLVKITGANDEELNRLMQENLKNTQINAQSDTNAIYDYWCSVGEAAEAASLAYENKEFNPPGFNKSGGSKSPNVKSFKGKSAKEATSTLERLDSNQIQNLIDDYRRKAEDASNKAADYISKKVGAGASVGAFKHSADNAISGVGNGKSKEKEKKEEELKELDEEFDRYWNLKKAIDAVDRSIKKLNKDQENLYGYELINSLRQENKLLEQQRVNYEKLLQAQKKEAAELRNQLSTRGLMFDASGAIINYAQATQKALAAYNDAVQKYNAGLIDETAFKVYEKSFEEFKKLLDRYDELYYTEIQDTKEKLDEIRREELANNLKAWEVEIDLKLNLKELKRGWNDFLKEINEDFKKVYQDLRIETDKLRRDAQTYIGDDGTIATTINAIHDVTAEIDKMRAGGSSDMFESISQAQEKLKELNTQLQSDAKDLHDAWKEAWQSYLDGIDQVADKFDDLMEQFERMDDELAFQGQIIELLYGEKAYDLMDTLYKGQEKSLMNQIKSVKDQLDMWKELWERSGATMENQADWTEDQKKYYDQWTKAQSSLNDLVIDYIKLLKEDYLNTIDQVLNDLEKSLTNGSSIKDMRTEWERISAYSDKYLDDVEQAYETQKLANKIDQSIANTSSLKHQQKLQALRDKEIKYLREKENLTQYDLDAAEARYQIALKEMALEDARNNKTSMKLVRNEQGDWSYQYLADEENVMMKQQELLDAYNDLYQLASDAYEANLEALQDLQEKYLETAKEIYLDETLSEEEKQQKLYELREWYFEQYGLLAEENTLYRNDLATSSAALLLEIYKEDKDAYKSMTDEERALVDALINANIEDYADLENKIKDNYEDIGKASDDLMASTRRDWSSTAQRLADEWNADNGQSVKGNVLEAHQKIEEATAEYQAKVEECGEEVGRSFGPEGITGAIEGASEATDDLQYRTEDLVSNSTAYLEELQRAVEDIENAWMSVKGAIEDAIYKLEEYIRLVNQIPGPQSPVTPISTPEYVEPTPEPQQEEAPAAETPHRTAPLVLNPAIGVNPDNEKKESLNYVSSVWTDQNGAGLEKLWVRSTSGTEKNVFSSYDHQQIMDMKRGYTVGTPISFDSGGYTGDWENYSGKMAILHEKELVLNKDDTTNFLSGISMLRDMSNLNGSINGAITQAVANMINMLGHPKTNIGANTVINESTSSSEGDTFNIYADFPNANDVNEIREALLSLPNLASQYVARNYK